MTSLRQQCAWAAEVISRWPKYKQDSAGYLAASPTCRPRKPVDNAITERVDGPMPKKVPGWPRPVPDFQTVLDNSATTREEALSPRQQIPTKEVDLLRAQLMVARAEIDNLVRAITSLTAAYDSGSGQYAETRIASLISELTVLARTYDPDCEVYRFEEQSKKMEQARACRQALVGIAHYLDITPTSHQDLEGVREKVECRVEQLTMENQKLQAEVTTLTAAVDTLREELANVAVQPGFYRCCYCIEVDANSPEEAAVEAEKVRRALDSLAGIWDVYAMRKDGTSILPPVTIDIEQLRDDADDDDDDEDEQEST